jgi:hypothetical protein
MVYHALSRGHISAMSLLQDGREKPRMSGLQAIICQMILLSIA